MAIHDNGLPRNEISREFLGRIERSCPGSLSWMNPNDMTVELRWGLGPEEAQFPVCIDLFSVVPGSCELSFSGNLETELHLFRHLTSSISHDVAVEYPAQAYPWANPQGRRELGIHGQDAQGEALYISERDTAGLLANLERHRHRLSRVSVSGGISKTGSRKTNASAHKKSF
jgi:hypothetical protein